MEFEEPWAIVIRICLIQSISAACLNYTNYDLIIVYGN